MDAGTYNAGSVREQLLCVKRRKTDRDEKDLEKEGSAMWGGG